MVEVYRAGTAITQTAGNEWINLEDEPEHQELCTHEQRYFLKAIKQDID